MAVLTPSPFPKGFRLIDGGKLNTLFASGGQLSVEDAITATAGGNQATARALLATINRLSVVATNNDSVKLPPGQVGMSVLIINDGAATAQVFGSGSDTIDAVATATGVVLTNAKRCWYYCISVTAAGIAAWVSDMGIKSA